MSCRRKAHTPKDHLIRLTNLLKLLFSFVEGLFLTPRPHYTLYTYARRGVIQNYDLRLRHESVNACNSLSVFAVSSLVRNCTDKAPHGNNYFPTLQRWDNNLFHLSTAVRNKEKPSKQRDTIRQRRATQLLPKIRKVEIRI